MLLTISLENLLQTFIAAEKRSLSPHFSAATLISFQMAYSRLQFSDRFRDRR
jgi:hypothetical protein